jgi:hypothetical protein
MKLHYDTVMEDTYFSSAVESVLVETVAESNVLVPFQQSLGLYGSCILRIYDCMKCLHMRKFSAILFS